MVSDLNTIDEQQQPIQQEIAGTGMRRDITRINTWLDELIPPQDRILWTKGAGNLEIYERVLEDDQVKSTMQQRVTGLLSREWEVLPGDERKSSQKAADFIKEILEFCDWDDICDKALYGVFYGFTLAECLWMRDGDYITLDDTKGGIRVRNRRRFAFDDRMHPRLLTWENYLLGEELPPRKFWYFCSGADNHDDPYGRALASWLYWPVFFKRGGLKKWLVFLEKFAQPTATGKYAPGTSQADQAKLLEITRAISEQTGVILPEGMMVELLEASRSGTADYTVLHDKMNAAVSKVVLSQTMTTDSGSSYAQAYVHDGVRKDVVKADADLINKSFNRQVVRWLLDFNAEKFRGAAYPQVWRRIEDEPDLKPQSERDKTLFDMGFRPTIEYVTETYGEGFVDAQAQGEDEGGEEARPPLFAGLGVGGTQSLLDFVNNTTLPQDKAIAVMVRLFGMSAEDARSMLPEERPEPEGSPLAPLQNGGTEQPSPQPSPIEGEAAEQPAEDPEEIPPSPPLEGGDEETELAGRRDTVELFVERLQEQAAPEFGKWFAHIRELMGESKDLQEFREKLAEGYPALDGDRLSQVMTEALFSGRLAGFYEAQEASPETEAQFSEQPRDEKGRVGSTGGGDSSALQDKVSTVKDRIAKMTEAEINQTDGDELLSDEMGDEDFDSDSDEFNQSVQEVESAIDARAQEFDSMVEQPAATLREQAQELPEPATLDEWRQQQDQIRAMHESASASASERLTQEGASRSRQRELQSEMRDALSDALDMYSSDPSDWEE